MADEAVNDHVRSVKRLLQLLILGCAFAVLIAFKTTTEKLMVNTGIISMPVLGSTLRTHSFYMAGPAALMLVWGYFLLRTHRLWELMHPSSGFRTVTPWLGVDFAEFHKSLGQHKTPVRLSAAWYVVLAWLMVPTTLGLLWFKYLPRHQSLVGVFPTPWLWFVASIAVAFLTYIPAVNRLDRSARTAPYLTGVWNCIRSGKGVRRPVAVLALLSLLVLVAAIITQWCVSVGENTVVRWPIRWFAGFLVALTATFCLGLALRYLGLARKWAIWSAVVFFAAAFAETKRAPFDMPEAESELVAGYFTEYSSLKFAMFSLGEFVEVVLLGAVFVVLFLGGWQVPWLYGDGFHLPHAYAAHALVAGLALPGLAGLWIARTRKSGLLAACAVPLVLAGGLLALTVDWVDPGTHLSLPYWLVQLLRLGAMVAKVVFLCWFQLMVRWTLPRFRYDHVMRLTWRYILPLSLVNILITGLVVLL